MADRPADADEASGFVVSPTPEGARPRERIVLNVGCGYPRRQGLHPAFHGPEWRELRLDIDPAVKPDIVCSITAMDPVATGSVDAVWSSHNLEHLYRHEVPRALAEFLRVLRPGGLLLLTLPDLQKAARHDLRPHRLARPGPPVHGAQERLHRDDAAPAAGRRRVCRGRAAAQRI